MFSFRPNASRSQKIADVLFGMIAPILSLIFDPIVFRPPEDPCGISLFAKYATFAYTAIGLGIFLLAVWLFFGEQFKIVSAFFAGVFFVGFMLSLLLGIVLLPFSLFGLLLAGLGLLGLLPFVTALVYLRNGIKALSQSQEPSPTRLSIRIILVIVGAGMILGLPALTQYYRPPVLPDYATQPCSSE